MAYLVCNRYSYSVSTSCMSSWESLFYRKSRLFCGISKLMLTIRNRGRHTDIRTTRCMLALLCYCEIEVLHAACKIANCKIEVLQSNLQNMNFDEILDLTAGVSFSFEDSIAVAGNSRRRSTFGAVVDFVCVGACWAASLCFSAW